MKQNNSLVNIKRRDIPLESAVEKTFLTALKKSPYGLKVRKMNGIGYRSWPDRLVFGPKKFFIFIELKRPILGKLSPGQMDLFAEMEDLGHQVPVFTDGNKAAAFVLAELDIHLHTRK